MEFTERFRLAREYRMTSLHSISEITNIRMDKLEGIASGATPPDEKSIIEISQALGVSKEYLENDGADYSCKRIKLSRLMTIKGLLILGTILSAVDIVLSLIPLCGKYCFFGFFFWLVAIPYYLFMLHYIENAKNREGFVKYGVISMLMLSLIGGIAILIIKDEDFDDCLDIILAKSHYSKAKPIPSFVKEPLYLIEKKRRKKTYFRSAR